MYTGGKVGYPGVGGLHSVQMTEQLCSTCARQAYRLRLKVFGAYSRLAAA